MSNYNVELLQQTIDKLKNRLIYIQTEFKEGTIELEDELNRFSIELTEFVVELEDQITFVLLEDPHYVCPAENCFHTYSKSNLIELICMGNAMCPACRCQFTLLTIEPNHIMQSTLTDVKDATRSISAVQQQIKHNKLMSKCGVDMIPDTIIELCINYFMDPTYVFTLIDMEYFVVLTYLPETITNESRDDVVDSHYARFRGSAFKVTFIVNINNSRDLPRQIHHQYRYTITTYTVGKIVRSISFDRNVNIHSEGIHYYKTPMAACMNIPYPRNYTGLWIIWHDNGGKARESSWVDGRLNGQFKIWRADGRICVVLNYVNGSLVESSV